MTLVTGDKVALTTGPDGKKSVNMLSGAGTSKTFQTASGQNGDLYVYPEDAMAALASSTADGELFNVSRMIRDGYGDAKTDEVPAIVDFQGKPTAAALKQKTEDLPGSGSERVAPRLGLSAVHVDKHSAKGFWQAVKPAPARSRSAQAATVPPLPGSPSCGMTARRRSHWTRATRARARTPASWPSWSGRSTRAPTWGADAAEGPTRGVTGGRRPGRSPALSAPTLEVH
ncbi:hypothetical protein [Streptomyces sp. LN785]|uniref:hypothetical protein n=1 Tax=Streptomyces sp. LN785 TaxID=3112983 RepID=UPI00371C68D3